MTNHSKRMTSVRLSVFEKLDVLALGTDSLEFIRLHQGKTTFAPSANVREWPSDAFPIEPHVHPPPSGMPILVSAVLEHLRRKGYNGLKREQIGITCGATHAIALALSAVVEPGDEVLVLSPLWLFAVGIVKASGALPVEVPAFVHLGNDPRFDLRGALEQNLRERTKAIYFNTPNNPTGVALSTENLRELISFACEHDLWIISDNAYEAYDFRQGGFVDPAILPGASDRVFSVFTFSKTHAMPGYRVGFVVSPEPVSELVRKLVLHSVYAISTSSQYGAFQALSAPHSIIKRNRAEARKARDLVESGLEVPHSRVDGGFYAFLDVSQTEEGGEGFLQACLDRGVSVSPGGVFGRGFENFARICFTAVGLKDLAAAIHRLNDIYRGA